MPVPSGGGPNIPRDPVCSSVFGRALRSRPAEGPLGGQEGALPDRDGEGRTWLSRDRREEQPVVLVPFVAILAGLEMLVGIPLGVADESAVEEVRGPIVPFKAVHLGSHTHSSSERRAWVRRILSVPSGIPRAEAISG